MAMTMGRGGEDESDDEERIRDEKEERREKNRIWRENREKERRRMTGETSEDEKEEDDLNSVSSHISQVQSFLTCSSCQDGLSGRIWQCGLGHPVCKDCVDESWLEHDSNSSQTGSRTISSMDGRSTTSDDSLKGFIEQMSENELKNFLDSTSDSSSHVTFSGPTLAERNIPEIDWFLNTLDIKKDAIKPYHDYHNEEQEEENESTEDDSDNDTDTTTGEREDNLIPKDEVEMLKFEATRKARLATFDESESGEDSVNASVLSFSKPRAVIQPIDWFEGTIEVKKDIIQPYFNYSCPEEELRNVKISDEVEIIQTEEEARNSRRSKICPTCSTPVIGRNLFLESVIATVNKNP